MKPIDPVGMKEAVPEAECGRVGELPCVFSKRIEKNPYSLENIGIKRPALN
jgi:hypothetical protein